MRNDFRKLAHLCEQLGNGLFRVLLDPNNTGQVRKLCEQIVYATPTKMRLGDRTYTILPLLYESETIIGEATLTERAAEMEAAIDQEEASYIVAHTAEIPEAMRGLIYFLFPGWRWTGSKDVACLRCFDPDSNWRLECDRSTNGFRSSDNDDGRNRPRLLRRVK